MEASSRRSGSTAVLGAALVVVGAMILVGQFLRIDLWRFIWPLFVMVPGIALFAWMASGGRQTAFLAVPASIITMTGLILLYQSVTDHWESWAYVWALIVPVAVGIGLVVQGQRVGKESLRRAGQGMMRVGLIIFLVAGTLFELVFRISGSGVGQIFWPSVLVVVGLYLIFWRSARPAPTVPAAAAAPQPLAAPSPEVPEVTGTGEAESQP